MNLRDESRKRQLWYRPAASLRLETAVFATLGVVASSAVVIAMVWASVPARESKAPMPARQKLPVARGFTRDANSSPMGL